MPYVSELLIQNDEPLILARIKSDGEIINRRGEEGYPCLAIRSLSHDAIEVFGNSADRLRAAIPQSDPQSATQFLTCPILGAMPKEPYTVEDGYTYEKCLWDRWATECIRRPDGLTSPMTRARIVGEPVKNDLVAKIIDDVATQLRAENRDVEVGSGKKTIEEIWKEFSQRQRERLSAIGGMFSLSATCGAAAAIASSNIDPVPASSFVTSSGSSLVGAAAAIVTEPIGVALDTISASAESSSVVIGRNSCSP